jgi:replicative DNA helicase
MGMLNSVPTAATIEPHARKVRDKAKLRELIHTCTAVIEDAYRQEQDADVILQQAALSVGALADAKPGEIAHIAATLQDYMTDLRTRADEVQAARDAGRAYTGMRGLRTSYKTFDTMMGGLRDSELTIIAGRPGTGKSLWALNILDRVTANGVPAVMFNLEMGPGQISERLIAANSMYSVGNERHGISSTDLTGADFSAEQWAVIHSSCKRLMKQPLYLCTRGTQPLAYIRAQVGTLVRQHGIRLVVVDYLQLMADGDKPEHRVAAVTAISRGLKQIAKDYSIPVVALSQLSRKNAQDKRRPELVDLRDSGSIEQDADVVCFIHDPNPTTELVTTLKDVTIIIAKNRNGPCCDVPMRWWPPVFRFYDVAPRSMAQGDEHA